MTIATIVQHPIGPGPAILDLLAATAARDGSMGEIALLHSGDNRGHSVLAAGPLRTIIIESGDAEHWPNRNPLQALQVQWDEITLNDAGHPAPLVGWIGGISYDIGRHLEKIGGHAPDDMHWPVARFSLFAEYYVLDHATNHWTIATLQMPGESSGQMECRLQAMKTFLRGVQESPGPVAAAFAAPELLEFLDAAAYIKKVERVIGYIAAGDVYQVNLAQRWKLRTPMPPVELFRRLAARSPAPYAAFLRWQDRAIVSASPETFLQRAGEKIQTRPIKGTRPRGDNPAHDARLCAELLASPKDAAELAMIVDLLRNDLGRVCAFGSVKVTEARRVEGHPTVWHTVGIVDAILASHVAPCDWASFLAALCPGGSITGAPKIRAMQIIEELEGHRRGWYCGNVGWIGPRGGELNIAIRTILLRGELAWVHAGGGVVADSDPAGEYEETLIKARAMLEALGL